MPEARPEPTTPREGSGRRHSDGGTRDERLLPGGWKAVVTVAILSLAGFLLYRTLSRFSWDEIIASVAAIPPSRLLAAGGFAAASYLSLTGFDWLALRYVRHALPYPKVALASFTSLSLGHNIGFAALSSGAVRYRFYSRYGLSAGEIAKVILFCGVTVGLGLMTLGAVALLVQSELAEELTGLDRQTILALGTICLALAVAYLLLAAFVRRPLRVRQWSLEMPPFRLAVGQLVIGPVNFACVAASLHQLIIAMAEIDYAKVAAAYVVANLTSILSHVPGGLGVLEAVVAFLLPRSHLIGSLIAFRFVYFLVPLALGGLLFAAAEIAFRRHRQRKDGAKERNCAV